MEDQRKQFHIEEYKEVRGEIVAREKAIMSLLPFGLIVSVSILTALCAHFFGANDGARIFKPIYSFAFLAPNLIMLPIFFIAISHRNDMHRSGTYLQVFFEETRLGPMWETRLKEFRRINSGESLDYLHWIIWVVCIISLILFVFSFLNHTNATSTYIIWSSIITWLAVIGATGYAHKLFAESLDKRDKFYGYWKDVRKNESKSTDKE